MKKLYFFTGIIFCFLACQPNKKAKNDLNQYFEQEFHVKIPPQVHTLIVLDEVGCKGCNLNLHNWIQKKALDHEKIWILVIAAGVNIDISAYLNVKYKNVFVEQHLGAFKELNLFASSGFIFLKQGKIEQTHIINVQELENQLKMLNERVNL